jgi:hypothetical protein
VATRSFFIGTETIFHFVKKQQFADCVEWIAVSDTVRIRAVFMAEVGPAFSKIELTLGKHVPVQTSVDTHRSGNLLYGEL